MRAQNHSIKEILGSISGKENFYIIPPYQREYAWGKSEWEQLFNDILDNGKNYFLGSIICIENESKNSGEIYYDLIDGQQRLTTISILLASAYYLIYEFNKKNPNILNFLENENFTITFSMIKKLLLFNREKPKLTLSLQKNNNEDYFYLLQNKILFEKFISPPSNYGNRRISKADNFFYELLNDLLDENENDIAVIFNFIEDILSAIIVKIDVEDISSAFTLFESINNRGIPLTPIDLIKNSIIKHMHKEHNKDPQYSNQEWQIIINNIDSYNDQVRFMRHYYHAFKYKYKEYNLSYSKATRSNLIKIYQELIKKDVKKIFNELLESSKIYSYFVHPERIEDKDFQKYQENFENFLHLGVAPSYALLLYLIRERLLDQQDFEEMLNFIEKWFIRRNLTNYPATNRLDSIFLSLINDINNHKDEGDSRHILSFIKKELTKSERFMNDKEFRKFLETRDLYEENTQALKYLLVKLEMSKRTDETKTDFWETMKGNQPKWTIEHILPQNPNKDSEWIKLFGDEIEKYQKMLGNFTLTCYNSNLSNQSFEKKSHYKDRNNNDIGLKSGNVKINDFIKKCDSWTKKCIEDRTRIMIKEIENLLKV